MEEKLLVDIELISNWKNTLINVFEKNVGDFKDYDLTDVDIKDLWKYFDFPKFIEVKNDRSVTGEEYEGFQEVAMVQDMEHENEPSLEYFNIFIRDYVIEIFGHTIEKTKGVIHKLNKLTHENGLTVYSKYKGKIRPSILFFLSKYGFEGNVLFINPDQIDESYKLIDTTEKLNELLKIDE